MTHLKSVVDDQLGENRLAENRRMTQSDEQERLNAFLNYDGFTHHSERTRRQRAKRFAIVQAFQGEIFLRISKPENLSPPLEEGDKLLVVRRLPPITKSPTEGAAKS